MNTRRITPFLLFAILAGVFLASVFLFSCESRRTGKLRRVPLLANREIIVYKSPSPTDTFCYSPGLVLLPTGRLLATVDVGGPGVERLSGPNSRHGGSLFVGKVFLSDNRGRTWRHVADYPFLHARPFLAGSRIYVLGHSGDLMIMYSDDLGLTWSMPTALTTGQMWHQAPCNVLQRAGKICLVMERVTDPDMWGWKVNSLAPVLMAAQETDDLTRPESWTFSNELAFRDCAPAAGLGIPFWPLGANAPGNVPDSRVMYVPGWLETNIVEFTDPDHVWYDPAGRTFYLWMRAHTGLTNLACIARAREDAHGRLTVEMAQTPSGTPILYIPCPGGHLKFHVLYDSETRLFWLLSSMSRDSMTSPARLSPDRYNLPDNERDTLALHFSKNMVDWRFAGIVATTPSPRQARHYASMVIDGKDLHVLSRSGDADAISAHDGNLITFHTVHNFRSLTY